jgi:hypothetical protein
MHKFRIKLNLDSQDINMNVNASITLINNITNIVHRLIAKIRNRKVERASTLIAFANKLPTLWHDKFIQIKHYINTIPTQKGVTN